MWIVAPIRKCRRRTATWRVVRLMTPAGCGASVVAACVRNDVGCRNAWFWSGGDAHGARVGSGHGRLCRLRCRRAGARDFRGLHGRVPRGFPRFGPVTSFTARRKGVVLGKADANTIVCMAADARRGSAPENRWLTAVAPKAFHVLLRSGQALIGGSAGMCARQRPPRMLDTNAVPRALRVANTARFGTYMRMRWP